MDRLVARKQKSTLIFLISYLLIVMFIAYFYNNISTQSEKNLSSNSNKLEGVKYLKLLQTLSTNKIHNSEEDVTPEEFNIHIDKTLKYLKKHPQLNSNSFKTYLTTELKSKNKVRNDYDFFDMINAENYVTGSRSGLIFSKSKEDYFLATLMTHYLPELLASINIVHAILEEYIDKNYIGEESKKYFIENKKLMNLSLYEVSSIISLLEDYEGSKELRRVLVSLTEKIKEFTLNGLLLSSPTKELLTNYENMHSIRDNAYTLNNINNMLLERHLYVKKVAIEQEIFSFDFLLIGILIVFSAGYFYFYLLYNNKHDKRKEQKLQNFNNLLQERVKTEISKNRKQEQQLIAQSRLAQMGEMISMIAHQWRQPLSAISTTAINLKFKIELETFSLDTKESKEECQSYFLERLTNIETFVQSLGTTIDDFRNFYKPNKKSEICIITKPIDKAIEIVRASMDSVGIELYTFFKSVNSLELFPNEIMQVILNILQNAKDNFIEKKTENAKISIYTEDKDDKVLVRFIDNGTGIPLDVIEKIFDPYFSTKNEKNGTGLGLYMSKQIIEDHHNGLLFVDNVDEGVCFTIELSPLRST